MLQEERIKRQQFEQLQAAKEMEFKGKSKLSAPPWPALMFFLILI